MFYDKSIDAIASEQAPNVPKNSQSNFSKSLDNFLVIGLAV
jgi:hypothetical protein